MKLPRPLLTSAFAVFLGSAAALSSTALLAQPPGDFGPPPGGGFGPPPGGGFGQQPEVKLLDQFDKDGDKMLDAAERKAARAHIAANPLPRGRGGFGRGGRGGAAQEVPQPGAKLTPADVKSYGKESLYDTTTLRTLFFTFEDADWEKQMEEFHNTDIELAATLVVDGKTYRDVGVSFRGASSYSQVGTGWKRSLAVSLDTKHEKQDLLGFRTLNLLNSHGDPSFLRAPLYSRIAQDYIPTPRVNFVRVVINGENWGIYANAEQFNKDFTKDRFDSTKARWKVPGSPGGRGSLAYLGDSPDAYRGIYEIKTKDDPKSWALLAKMTKVLNETAPEKLEAELAPLLDIDGALKFLALDVTFVNGDGYWTRTSDYSIAEDDKGRLHIIPHDMNETFSTGAGGRGGRGGPGGPGGRGGGAPGRGGVTLDPLAPASNEGTPLAAKLLAAPALRTRYLGYVRDLAENKLDWAKLGPIAQQYHDLIAADVQRDTRKLESYEDFTASLGDSPRSLKTFADQRRAHLLDVPAIKELPRK